MTAKQKSYHRYMMVITRLILFIGIFFGGRAWVESDYLKECNERCDALIDEYCKMGKEISRIFPINISINSTINISINSTGEDNDTYKGYDGIKDIRKT